MFIGVRPRSARCEERCCRRAHRYLATQLVPQDRRELQLLCWLLVPKFSCSSAASRTPIRDRDSDRTEYSYSGVSRSRSRLRSKGSRFPAPATATPRRTTRRYSALALGRAAARWTRRRKGQATSEDDKAVTELQSMMMTMNDD